MLAVTQDHTALLSIDLEQSCVWLNRGFHSNIEVMRPTTLRDNLTRIRTQLKLFIFGMASVIACRGLEQWLKRLCAREFITFDQINRGMVP